MLEEVKKEIDELKRKNPKGVPWISAPELKQRLENLNSPSGEKPASGQAGLRQTLKDTNFDAGMRKMLEEVKKIIDEMGYDEDAVPYRVHLKQRLENLNSREIDVVGKPMIPSAPKTSGNVTSVTPDTNFDDFVKELKDKNFIMSILNDCVTVDTEEELKFICVADVQKKIDELADKYRKRGKK